MQSKMQENQILTQADVQKIIDIGRKAGEVTLKYFRADVEIQIKDNNSPVTLADQEAEELILPVLKEIAPSVPIVAEELFADGGAPSHEDLTDFWLVDPLDGTKEFINGRRDYTVNIAYMKDKKPYFGYVFAPARDLEFYGFSDDAHAYMRERDKTEFVPIQTAKRQEEGVRVVSSLSHSPKEGEDTAQDILDFKNYLSSYKIQDHVFYGSSLKFCAIAAGLADLYPRFKPTSEWDTAAGDAILQAAGGEIVTLDNKTLTYAKRADYLNPFFIARSIHLR